MNKFCLSLTSVGAIALFATPNASPSATHQPTASDKRLEPKSPSFEDRVTYQRAIEEIYWRHRIWPAYRADGKPSLDRVISAGQIKRKVEDYLRKSEMLADYWQRAITPGQLQAEMDRIARETKQPDVLREIFAALDNDPAVIAECLARPVLAERLVRELSAQNQNGNSGSQWLRVASLPKAVQGAFARNTAKRAPISVAEVSSGTYALPEITSTSSNCSDNWTGAASSGVATGAVYNTAVWTGSEMIVWGGTTGAPYYNTGARYDPSTDSWTATSLTNAPDARGNHTAVWTGTEMIIWGGVLSDGHPADTGARYNPSTDSWSATSITNAPAARTNHTAVWTGSEMIVWGGNGLNNFDSSTGGRYNPTTDSWTATSSPPDVRCGDITICPLGLHAHTAVWTGSEMIVWGGFSRWDNSYILERRGARYNPNTDSWTLTNADTLPAQEGRYEHTAVWTGNEMIIWGGGGNTGLLNTGERYDPGTETWTTTSTTNAPDARWNHTAVWTGSEMIVWGGGSTPDVVNTGGRYSPGTDTWTATTTMNAPYKREGHTAVWTGTEMIIFGGVYYVGFNNLYLGDAWRYCGQVPTQPTATWNANPGSGDWNDDANWSPMTAPNGPAAIASFGTSNQIELFLSAVTEVNGINFLSEASPFTITVSPAIVLTISGAGITNDSNINQYFVTAVDENGNIGGIVFANSAAAGSTTNFTNSGPTAEGAGFGYVAFLDTSDAGNANFFRNLGSAVSGLYGGAVYFYNASKAGTATLFNDPGTVSGANGGFIQFHQTATAENGFILNFGAATNASGGRADFYENSTAGNGHLRNDGAQASDAGGGLTIFFDTSNAGSARFDTFGGFAEDAVGGSTEFRDSTTAGSAAFGNGGAEVAGAFGGHTQFFDNASAGVATFNNQTAFATRLGGGGGTIFYNNSTAGNGTFINQGARQNVSNGSFTDFFDTATADHGIFYSYGSFVSGGGPGGFVEFFNSSTAANGIFTAYGGEVEGANRGHIDFYDSSTAANATLIAYGGPGNDPFVGGVIRFWNAAVGDAAAIQVYDNGNLDISVHDAPGVSVGSIEGTGVINLGAFNLGVGTNNNDTTFSGVIQDGGQAGGTGGSLTKVGTGILSLTSANTYTGRTTVNAGTLEAFHDGALGGGDVTMLTAGATLTLQDGANNDYISDTATVKISSSATLNLNYTGTDTIGVLIIDGVAQTPGLHGSGGGSIPNKPQLSTSSPAALSPSGISGSGQILAQLPVAVSRKLHNGTAFDVYLPVTGSRGIECRTPGPGDTYQIVVSFLNPATFNDIQVSSGNGSVDTVSGHGTTTVTINLKNVTNQQVINVTMFGLDDGLGTRDLVIPMGLLIGDINGSGVVGSSRVDLQACKLEYSIVSPK